MNNFGPLASQGEAIDHALALSNGGVVHVPLGPEIVVWNDPGAETTDCTYADRAGNPFPMGVGIVAYATPPSSDKSHDITHIYAGWKAQEDGVSENRLPPAIENAMLVRRKMVTPAGVNIFVPTARLPAESVKATKIICKPPGTLMEAFSGIAFNPRTKERVFDQILADFRYEYFEELSQDARRVRFFSIYIRHWSGYVIACLIELGGGVAKVWKLFSGG